MTQEPKYTNEYWECPKCSFKNPYDGMIVDTYPPIHCYRCKNCDYHYDRMDALTPAEKFRMSNPDGKW
jgi:rubredoxin